MDPGAMRILVFAIATAGLLTCISCGQKKPTSSKSYSESDGATGLVPAPEIVGDPAETFEEHVPFAMRGGGAAHLHRTPLAGPARAPAVTHVFRTGARVFASAVVGPDGTVYLGAIDGSFNALRPNLELRWAYICDEPLFSTAAVSLSGIVYVGCDDDRLLAFSTDGALRWTYRAGHDVDSSPVIAPSGAIYVGADGLHAVSPRGERIFKVMLEGHVSASPTVRPDGMVVVGSHDHRVYAVDRDATVAWIFSTQGPVSAPAAALDNNDVVVGSDDGRIYRLAQRGGMRWKTETGGPVRAGFAVDVEQDRVYAASMDGHLYALDLEDGRVIWRVRTGGPLRASPLLDVAGRIYIGSRDHHLYAMDASSGEIVWRIDLGAEIDSSAALIEGGRLVVGCDDGGVRVVEEER